jgi:hypothetical protein
MGEKNGEDPSLESTERDALKGTETGRNAPASKNANAGIIPEPQRRSHYKHKYQETHFVGPRTRKLWEREKEMDFFMFFKRKKKKKKKCKKAYQAPAQWRPAPTLCHHRQCGIPMLVQQWVA